MSAPVKPFFRVLTPEEARAVLARTEPCGRERVPVASAAGRVVAERLVVPEDLPAFHRAHMDGYAVRARDTFGASASIPAYLALAGAIEMGREPPGPLPEGGAMRIATGGMLPEGADAVVMVEYTEEVAGDRVEVQTAVSPWQNVLRIGEDIGAGAEILPAGRRIRPHDVGALTGVGLLEVEVFRRPRIALIGTGDEIVDPAVAPRPGQVRNVNQYSLRAMAEQLGARVEDLGVCRDDPAEFDRLLRAGLELADAVVASGGSSVGAKDMTLEVISRLPGGEVLFHGISVSPGKPTLLATAEAGGRRKSVLGLPGHPVSALVIFAIFGLPLLRLLEGESRESAFRPRSSVPARLGRNVDSAPGREDYVRVRLVGGESGWVAEPLPGKSGAIFSLVHADGYVVVPLGAEGIEAGASVEVVLL